MKRPTFILLSDDNKAYTNLSHINEKNRMFRGEYSYLHDEHADDAFFLSRFLLKHHQKPLYLVSSDDSRYHEATRNYQHFSEDDISHYIEEKRFARLEEAKDQLMDRNLGQLQLSILKKMAEKELQAVTAKPANRDTDHYVFLGQQIGLEWVLRTIDAIVQKGDI